MNRSDLDVTISQLHDATARAALTDVELNLRRGALLDAAAKIRAGRFDGIAADDVDVLSGLFDAVNLIRDETAVRLTALVSPPAARVTAARMPSLAALAAARAPGDPGQPVPRVEHVRPRWELPNGTKADFADLSGIAERMLAARAELEGAPVGFQDRVTVASIKVPRPAEMEVRAGDDVVDVQRKIEAAVAPAQDPSAWSDQQRALVASGGWCAPPPEARYDIPSISTAARPVRDGLPRIGATHGAVQFVRAARLSTILASTGVTAGSAVSVWTAARDETPGGTTKPRQTFTCRTVVEEDVDAIVARVRFGNLHSRAFPEDVAAAMRLVMAKHARVAETKLLDDLIADMNIDVTQTGFLGTARDSKHHLSQAVEEIRYTERMGADAPMRAIASDVLLAMIVADVTHQQASGEVAALRVTKAWARAMLADLEGLNVTYARDVPTGADAFVTNADNENLADWPDNVRVPVFPDGSAVFLDGGELNLGIVRDPTLNDTNELEMFMETFEGLAWLGPYGKTVTLTTCPAGDSQAALDNTAALCTGS